MNGKRGDEGPRWRAQRLTAFVAAAAFAGLVPAAQAQQLPSVNDYRLPPPATATPAAPGPVDTGVPPPRPVEPRASQTATPEPQDTVPPARIVVPVPGGSRARTPAPASAGTAAPRPGPTAASTLPAPAPDPSTIATPAAGTVPSALPDAAPPPVTATAGSAPVEPTEGSLPDWLIPALLGAGAALGAALLWRRRRGSQVDEPAAAFVRPVVAAPPHANNATPPPPARTPPARQVAAEPAEPRHSGPGLALSLEAMRLSATLVNATLAYRLHLTNGGDQPMTDLAVSGDMIAAHASRPVDEQLGTAGGAALPPLHRVETLAPGQSVTLTGDIRLPLAAIRPIRRGDAALFVPLARIEAHGQAIDGSTISTRGTFLVGQEPDAGSERLQPFRLDLGPRVYAHVGQRLLAAAPAL